MLSTADGQTKVAAEGKLSVVEGGSTENNREEECWEQKGTDTREPKMCSLLQRCLFKPLKGPSLLIKVDSL